VPFYVVAPVSTIDSHSADGRAIEIEERDPAEVLMFDGTRRAPAGASGRNPAFDVTPAANVTAIITERGLHRPPYHSAIDALRAKQAVAG
jgi:methylthioribose-1-phosphate isomerase